MPYLINNGMNTVLVYKDLNSVDWRTGTIHAIDNRLDLSRGLLEDQFVLSSAVSQVGVLVDVYVFIKQPDGSFYYCFTGRDDLSIEREGLVSAENSHKVLRKYMKEAVKQAIYVDARTNITGLVFFLIPTW